MMKTLKKILLGLILLIIFVTILDNCSLSKSNTKSKIPEGTVSLPKALFITTGVNFNREDPSLPQGIVLAIQELNKNGIPVRLEPRDVLFDKNFLENYNILILLTTAGYHDVDRKYSLSYMTDEELNNIKEFVFNGGILIAGDNIGRNDFEGQDRILTTGELTPDNYPLSEVFGFSLEERNMRGFKMLGLQGPLYNQKITFSENDLWTLVPEEIFSKNVDTLAIWENSFASFPAVTKNIYGKGEGYFLAHSDLLQPINDGGISSIIQIVNFYKYVADDYNKQKKLKISLNPWPKGYEAAFAVSFNSEGNLKNYDFIINKLKDKNIDPTFFVNGQLSDDLKNYLKNGNFSLASSGYHYWNYMNIDYSESLNDILRNESDWNIKFKGFRFPFTTPNFYGMLAADLHGYRYESSISANQIDFIHGSVFPHNLVLAKNHFYKSSNMLEIAPTYHDDYYFLSKLMEGGYKTHQQMTKDILLYRQYLQDFWSLVIKPQKGVMLVLAHPGLTGYNEQTFKALESIIDTVKKDNAWITNLDKIVYYINAIQKLRVFVKSENHKIITYIRLSENFKIKNLTLNLSIIPKNITSNKGDVKVKKISNVYQIIFDAFDGQRIEIGI